MAGYVAKHTNVDKGINTNSILHNLNKKLDNLRNTKHNKTNKQTTNTFTLGCKISPTLLSVKIPVKVNGNSRQSINTKNTSDIA
jgi:hypothetical protein